MKIAVIDTETARWSDEVDQGWRNLEDFGLALLVIGLPSGPIELDFYMFSPYAEIPCFPCVGDFLNQTEVQNRLDGVDRIVSFNGDHFDLRILESAKFDTASWQKKSCDLLQLFTRVAGHRISLNNLSKIQLNRSKLFESGQQAVEYWRAGLELLRGWSDDHSNFDQEHSDLCCRRSAKYLFETVITYCKQDVHLTYGLYQHIQRHQSLSFWDRDSQDLKTVKMVI